MNTKQNKKWKKQSLTLLNKKKMIGMRNILGTDNKNQNDAVVYTLSSIHTITRTHPPPPSPLVQECHQSLIPVVLKSTSALQSLCKE